MAHSSLTRWIEVAEHDAEWDRNALVYIRADDPAEADLVVVNTCAFIESARQESIDTVLELAGSRKPGARLVVQFDEPALPSRRARPRVRRGRPARRRDGQARDGRRTPKREPGRDANREWREHQDHDDRDRRR